MSASPRRRLASHLSCAVAAAAAGAACTAADPSPQPPPGAGPAAQRLADALERLDALEIVELGAVAETRTEHQWVPYGGTWAATEVELTIEEQADRVAALADVAEQVVGAAGPADIADDFGDAAGAPALCTRLDGRFCLDRELHAANLDALDQLEIVDVVDIVRSAPAMDAFCYTSWDTVREDDCVRALEVQALVDATREFPSATPPDGAPE